MEDDFNMDFDDFLNNSDEFKERIESFQEKMRAESMAEAYRFINEVGILFWIR